MLINMYKLLGVVIALLLSWATCMASIQPPRWSGWQLDITKSQCRLENEFEVHPGSLESNGGFLEGTTFKRIGLIISARTHSRDSDRYHIGEAVFGVNIRSHVDLEPAHRVVLVDFGGEEKDAVVWGERPQGDKLKERSASFWFYGTRAKVLIDRLSQGESLNLTFFTRFGVPVVETEISYRDRGRFRAWAAAFRSCVIENRE